MTFAEKILKEIDEEISHRFYQNGQERILRLRLFLAKLNVISLPHSMFSSIPFINKYGV